MRAADLPLLPLKRPPGIITRRSELNYLRTIANALLSARGQNGLTLTVTADRATLSGSDDLQPSPSATSPPFLIAKINSIAAQNKFKQLVAVANIFANLQAGPGISVVKSDAQVVISLAATSPGQTSGAMTAVNWNPFPLMTFRQWNALATVFNAMLNAFGDAGIDVHISKEAFVFAMNAKRLEENISSAATGIQLSITFRILGTGYPGPLVAPFGYYRAYCRHDAMVTRSDIAPTDPIFFTDTFFEVITDKTALRDGNILSTVSGLGGPQTITLTDPTTLNCWWNQLRAFPDEDPWPENPPQSVTIEITNKSDAAFSVDGAWLGLNQTKTINLIPFYAGYDNGDQSAFLGGKEIAIDF